MLHHQGCCINFNCYNIPDSTIPSASKPLFTLISMEAKLIGIKMDIPFSISGSEQTRAFFCHPMIVCPFTIYRWKTSISHQIPTPPTYFLGHCQLLMLFVYLTFLQMHFSPLHTQVFLPLPEPGMPFLVSLPI